MKRVRPQRLPGAALLLICGWACEPEASESGFTVRDSAGVEIVESRSPAWSPGGEWRVGQEALARIGVVDGDPNYQLDQVVGAVRLPDGVIVLGDFGSQEVRMFSADGEYLRTVGRKGGGPGEFTGLSGLGGGSGNRAWAYDFSLRRVTWLDATGALPDQVQLGPEPPVLNAVGSWPDGTFVLKQLWGATAVSEANELGLRRDPIAYVCFDETGTLVDTLGMFPGRELVITQEDGRGVMGSAPLGRSSSSAVRGDRLVVGSQEGYELAEYGGAGELLRILRLPDRDLTTSAEDVEEYIRSRLEGVPSERQGKARLDLENQTMPPTRPAYGTLESDAHGNLWVADYAPFPRLPRSWSVFGPDGRWLGEVEMPERFTPMDIGPDWILGMEQDELDVEYLVLYPLLKS